MKKCIKIEGMMCGHCKKSVEEALKSLKGAENVTVDLENKCAYFEGEADDKALKSAVESIGFDVVGIS